MSRYILPIVVSAASFFVIGCAKEEPAAPAPPPVARPVNGVIAVKVAGDFSPGRIELPAGEPVKIQFVRGNDPSCGDEVVFPSLNIRKKIPANATTVVELPAQKTAATLAFTCGMNMMKGSIVVQ